MLTADDFYTWRTGVLEYAEVTKGLDPIGASDMLLDLSRFCSEEFIHRIEDGATSLPDPEVTWQLFQASGFWSRYYPPALDFDKVLEESRSQYRGALDRLAEDD